MLSILIEGEKPIKSMILGNLLNALVNKRIKPKDFEEMTLIVQAASVPALKSLPLFFKKTKGKPYSHARTLMNEEALLSSMGIISRYGNRVALSELGKKLYSYGGFEETSLLT